VFHVDRRTEHRAEYNSSSPQILLTSQKRAQREKYFAINPYPTNVENRVSS